MNSFRSVFQQCCDDVNLTDMINSASLLRWSGSTVDQPEVTPTADECTADESIMAVRPTFVSDDRDSDHDAEHDARIGLRVSFLVPLHILCCMSTYPNLLVLYTILLSLPIRNCSAERSMSRLKLIKTRLWSTMSVEWQNSLMKLSSEKDIFDSLNVNDIINRFANQSAF